MANAPSVPATGAASGVRANQKQTNDEDAELERILANLKA